MASNQSQDNTGVRPLAPEPEVSVTPIPPSPTIESALPSPTVNTSMENGAILGPEQDVKQPPSPKEIVPASPSPIPEVKNTLSSSTVNDGEILIRTEDFLLSPNGKAVKDTMTKPAPPQALQDAPYGFPADTNLVKNNQVGSTTPGEKCAPIVGQPVIPPSGRSLTENSNSTATVIGRAGVNATSTTCTLGATATIDARNLPLATQTGITTLVPLPTVAGRSIGQGPIKCRLRNGGDLGRSGNVLTAPMPSSAMVTATPVATPDGRSGNVSSLSSSGTVVVTPTPTIGNDGRSGLVENYGSPSGRSGPAAVSGVLTSLETSTSTKLAAPLPSMPVIGRSGVDPLYGSSGKPADPRSGSPSNGTGSKSSPVISIPGLGDLNSNNPGASGRGLNLPIAPSSTIKDPFDVMIPTDTLLPPAGGSVQADSQNSAAFPTAAIVGSVVGSVFFFAVLAAYYKRRSFSKIAATFTPRQSPPKRSEPSAWAKFTQYFWPAPAAAVPHMEDGYNGGFTHDPFKTMSASSYHHSNRNSRFTYDNSHISYALSHSSHPSFESEEDPVAALTGKNAKITSRYASSYDDGMTLMTGAAFTENTQSVGYGLSGVSYNFDASRRLSTTSTLISDGGGGGDEVRSKLQKYQQTKRPSQQYVNLYDIPY